MRKKESVTKFFSALLLLFKVPADSNSEVDYPLAVLSWTVIAVIVSVLIVLIFAPWSSNGLLRQSVYGVVEYSPNERFASLLDNSTSSISRRVYLNRNASFLGPSRASAIVYPAFRNELVKAEMILFPTFMPKVLDGWVTERIVLDSRVIYEKDSEELLRRWWMTSPLVVIPTVAFFWCFFQFIFFVLRKQRGTK